MKYKDQVNGFEDIENIEDILDAASRFSAGKKLRAGPGAIRHKAGRILSRRKPARDEHEA